MAWAQPPKLSLDHFQGFIPFLWGFITQSWNWGWKRSLRSQSLSINPSQVYPQFIGAILREGQKQLGLGKGKMNSRFCLKTHQKLKYIFDQSLIQWFNSLSCLGFKSQWIFHGSRNLFKVLIVWMLENKMLFFLYHINGSVQ